MSGLVVVPIHHVERDKSALAYILNNCNIKCIFCEEESADLFRDLRATLCPQLEHIVIYTPDATAPGQTTSVIRDWTGLTRFLDLEAAGNVSEAVIYPLSPDDVASIIHTSGSTGKPKGAPFTDKLCREGLFTGYCANDPYVSVCFEPLAHISEREYMHAIFSSGGRVGLIDISDNLIDDIGAIGPCSMSTTPRFWNVLHSKYQQALFVEQTISKKDPAVIKKEVLTKFSKLLGNRLRSIGCGGAAPSRELVQFLEDCFGEVAVSDGYGSTEAGSIAAKGGYLVNNVQIKIVDVPELGYTANDLPYPRGELYVKTKTLIPGYYNNPEATATAFVDGWFCTGDIVERLEERRIKIIDRKKNFFKLSQGEFVAAEKLENRYLQSPYVDQIFITCGDITKFEQNSVFAIVVPHMHLVQKWAFENGILTKDGAELCQNPKIIAMIVESLQKVGKAESLAPYEIPVNIILEPEIFTVENGKMTSSNKLARPILERFYKDAVNKKLEELSKKNEVSLWKILSDIFGDKLAGGNFEEISAKTKSLSDIGGDSLSAVRLSSVLSNTLNLDIPPHILLDKSTTIETIANLITSQKESANPSPSSSSSSPASLLSLPLNETLLKQIKNDLELISSLNPTPGISSHNRNTILVTGATGFVGAHLVQYILLNTPFAVTCLVRPKISKSGQPEAAQDRLTHALQDFQIWESLGDNTNRVKAVSGDLAREPNFGLADAEYSDLINTVDVVFHSGAVVNHALPYSAMRQENVIGTKQIIEFCWKSHKKPRLNFVSTISAIPGIPESSPKQAILEHVTSEMGGYEQSKWVAEKLVQQAVDKKLVSGGILRLGMVGWNSISGIGNPNDWLFYLFSGILQFEKFPDSDVEFEMLPVNVTCKILSQLGLDFPPDSNFDICGNKLISFQSLAKNLPNVEKVPFQTWIADLFAQIEKSPPQKRKLLEGLLLFSGGLPDERRFKREIEKRSEFVVSHFEEAAKVYSGEEIERYFKKLL
eukprot:Phypoly_transcript_01268.p1 GENE.Phypoly_transcript_01268~~Phypoly_transcript_01268.p1  ORF type:complete len:1160 (+),score=192.11 Phypoly_transcript_01268:494-3481(+)